MCCHFLLQGTFPIQGSNPGLPHGRHILYHLSHRRNTTDLGAGILFSRASQVALVVKNPPANAGDPRDAGSIPRETPWRRKWQLTPVFSSVQFSSVQSLSHVWLWLWLQPQGLQHTRPPCPSSTPGVYSNSCPFSWWCHPTISSSVIPFSSCLQSFPA